ncbi:MAG: tRNA (guanosine(18)-2'-O)-methyltransferase TrmH [Gammaproteobacteria bacterium]|jgi:tRNA (guanosine-2'-O-)-methyltransferase|nr:tRNA (guanosine(18)-2'-O)-methyltransferase TrmH [Gammaproteobacteria bacterium]
MTHHRYLRAREVLARRQPDLTVLLDNVHKPHNFSAVLRTCDAVGVFEAHAVWPSPRLRPHQGRAAGTDRWVYVRTHPSVEAAIAHLKAMGHAVVAAHPAPRATDFRAVDYTRPTALLLGAELLGVSEEALALADATVVVPLAGMVPSLNVSVAAAVILYEAQRQRAAAGLYDSPRLDPRLRHETLVEWLQPDVADYCRRMGLPFPEVEEDGTVARLPVHG